MDAGARGPLAARAAAVPRARGRPRGGRRGARPPGRGGASPLPPRRGRPGTASCSARSSTGRGSSSSRNGTFTVLVHGETGGRGDRRAWRAVARRAAGDTGAFVAELVERGVAGEMLPLLLPLTEPALDAGSAAVAFTRDVHARVGALRPGLPLAHVPLPLVAAGPPPDRTAARHAVGAAPGRALVAVLWPPGTLARERVAAAIAPLRVDPRTDLRELPPPGVERESLIAAADVLVALEHPSTGRLDPAVGAALHAGVATLVTAGLDRRARAAGGCRRAGLAGRRRGGRAARARRSPRARCAAALADRRARPRPRRRRRRPGRARRLG